MNNAKSGMLGERANGRWLFFFLLLLSGTILACNAISTAGRATAVPSAPQMTPSTGEATIIPPTASRPVERTPLPTFTPILSTRSATAVFTPPATINATVTISFTPTLSSTGLLALNYELSWRLVDNQAEGVVALTASGGNGDYRFYHDDIEQAEATFTFRWSTCRNKPGSFRVDSTDGQTARIEYYEPSPCPENN